jgi:hypothetical protein
MDYIELFIQKYPQYRWHSGLLSTLRALHEQAGPDRQTKFDLKAFCKKLNLSIQNVRNYFKRLEKLEVITWKRYLGKKGPIEILLK